MNVMYQYFNWVTSKMVSKTEILVCVCFFKFYEEETNFLHV